MTRLAAARQLYGSKALKSLMLSPWTARASMYRSATTLGNWHEVQRMGRCITLPDRPVCPSLLLLADGLNARRSQTALKPLLAAQFRGRRTGYGGLGKGAGGRSQDRSCGRSVRIPSPVEPQSSGLALLFFAVGSPRVLNASSLSWACASMISRSEPRPPARGGLMSPSDAFSTSIF